MKAHRVRIGAPLSRYPKNLNHGLVVVMKLKATALKITGLTCDTPNSFAGHEITRGVIVEPVVFHRKLRKKHISFRNGVIRASKVSRQDWFLRLVIAVDDKVVQEIQRDAVSGSSKSDADGASFTGRYNVVV